ncbi:MAG: hypothetical protein D9V44_08700 [Actinobacteria bacterium]|nr:MAG: hypothetical protein D9V44_08700 [Actinomycetota bacterium]
MRLKWLANLLKTLAVLAVLLVLAFVGMRAAVGTTGSGFPLIDVFFVRGDWLVPSRVALKDPATVYIEGYAPGLTWVAAEGSREWLVSGSTLVLTEANENTYPVPVDGRVIIEHTFGAGVSQQAAGWHVVKIQQYDLKQPKATAFVIVDLTKQVWLKRTGTFRWQQVPMQ